MKVSGIRSPLEFRAVHINGLALHVVLAGPANGRPLIFLHGFPEFWFGWRRQIDHFVSSGYRVIIPDQRGYNLSAKPAGIANYSIDLLARDVVGVLDAVASSKAFVVEHDWGAAVAWYLAARYSDWVSRTTILGVPHLRVFIKNLVLNPAQLRRSWYLLFFQLPWLPELILRRRDWALLVRVLRNTSPPGVFSDSDLEQYKKSWANKGALTAMLNWYRAALLRPPKFALDSNASRVKVPTLLIWGKNDQFLDEAMARESLQYCDHGHFEMLRVRLIGSNTKSPHRLIPCYRNSLPSSGRPNEAVVASSPCLSDYQIGCRERFIEYQFDESQVLHHDWLRQRHKFQKERKCGLSSFLPPRW
jgi:pimeloyl-ACP methyl ester carboxylesterase